jgi:hypothetical protein
LGTIFLSAFLLFMVQLMLGKRILPWFGGTPAVWTTCMLFFQVTLLAGYGYAHALGQKLGARKQAVVHLGLLVVALGWLGWWAVQWSVPLLADASWKPEGTEPPQGQILMLLLVSVGLPFLLLSTTSPLLQAWFSRAGHGEGTYRLYAVSNVGSLLGLVSYPFVIERWLPLQTQAWFWAGGFTLVTVGFGLCAWWARDSEAAEVEEKVESVKIPMGTVVTWLLLATATSAMLLAVTNELCQEVASVPFLWMLPLVLYLLSFIICFDRPHWYQRRWFLPVTLVVTLAVLVTAAIGLRVKVPVHIASFGAFLFFFCLTCHGELVRLRPPAGRLTLFYLMVALGGALGGIFVGVIAPRIFTNYWEFNIMVTLAWAVLAVIFWREKDSLFHRGDPWHFGLALWIVSFVVLRIVTEVQGWRFAERDLPNLIWCVWCSLIPAVIVGFLLRGKRVAGHWFWPRFTVGLVIFLAECFMVVKIKTVHGVVVRAERNFFGTLQANIVPSPEGYPAMMQLTHGQINHGTQFIDPELSKVPISYYGEESGIDLAVRFHPRRLKSEGMNIGVMGLGAGTMAAHGLKGDAVRFYEINRTVIDWAVGKEAVFGYLNETAAAVEVAEGDARLSLERELEAGSQEFDVLAMDAFSSDSVPVHLLTREALELYAKHLRDKDSVMAINISNRFLDFRDLMANQAADLGFASRVVTVVVPSPKRSQSVWMLLCRNEKFFKGKDVVRMMEPYQAVKKVRWSDDYSPIFPLLK